MIYFILGYVVGMATLIGAMLLLDLFYEKYKNHQPSPATVEVEGNSFDGSQFLDPEIKAYFDINSGGGYN